MDPRRQEENTIAGQQLDSKGPAPPENYLDVSLDDPVLCLKVRYWWFVVLAMQGFLYILMISCLSSPKWVKHGDLLLQWEGGVITCTSCDLIETPSGGSFDNDNYNSLKDSSDCDKPDTVSKSFCSAFEDLGSAGSAYFFFEMFSFLFLTIWLVRVAFLLLDKQCCNKLRFLGYVYPVIAFVGHLLAIVIWAGISEARFDNDCKPDNYDGDKPDLCATHGPALAVVTIFAYLVVISVFLFIFVKSAPAKLMKDQPPKKSDTPIDLNHKPASPRRPDGFSPAQTDQDLVVQLHPNQA